MSAREFLTGGRVLTEDGLSSGLGLLIEGGVILDLLPESSDTAAATRRLPEGSILAPGFIDIQVNGGGGVLFNETPTVDGALAIAAAHRRFGTTSLLPTIITDRAEVMQAGAAAARAAMLRPKSGIAGVHLEGPFISPRRPGVHDPARIRAMDQADADWLAAQADGLPMLLTIAPEEVADDHLRQLAKAGVVLSAGHTAASAERIGQAIGFGLRAFTHLFNAMPPLAGREPGPVGAALLDRTAWCGLIVDGVHVHPVSLGAALAARPLDRMVLVTDAMSVLGTDADGFDLYGQRILRRHGRLEREDGTLAGADLDMATAVRNSVEMLGCPVEQALRMAATYPAALMRLADRGMIAPGLRADLVLLTDGLQPIGTWLEGDWSAA
ncbi:N-acetylglucosamine-6-phosphate deacetylase [Acidisoma cellulosilytica]|uniref:N-acetylglucosamine-6-phosphate deacetylase n=1 Tax=Acidisoma cellulosilyticum TaxID=2802395 RepID=A0A964E3H4_9PROT|nr:N-acetylglucosamine-6-phosphate deacetylase [Acidisoma cellulosilyticum]MCB8880379.1 N-acetylglucosamine-6-phosphate deacetylase [Acidisoma cellulosilyticum]